MNAPSTSLGLWLKPKKGRNKEGKNSSESCYSVVHNLFFQILSRNFKGIVYNKKIAT